MLSVTAPGVPALPFIGAGAAVAAFGEIQLAHPGGSMHYHPSLFGFGRRADEDHPRRVFLAVRQELVRAGLRSWIAAAADLQVVGEEIPGPVARAACARLQPDLVLLEAPPSIARVRGVLLRWSQVCPQTPILLVVSDEHSVSDFDARRAGARGTLPVSVPHFAFLQAVRGALQDPLPPPLRPLRGRGSGEMAPTEWTGRPHLSAREREVLRLLSQGHSNRAIAQVLTLEVGTVKVHVEHILAKLGAPNRTAAAVQLARAQVAA
jgi:DNA-binding NarL/FixJ family response regulator